MGTQSLEIVSKNVQAIESILIDSQDRLAATLPQHIPPNQFILVAMDLIRGTPTLLRAAESPEGRLSIIKAIYEASDMGLMLTRHLGHSYLVPFKNGDLSKRLNRDIYEAQMIIGYRGFCHLIQRGDSNAKAPYSNIVWPQEQFQYNGPEQLPSHLYDTAGGRVAIGQDGLAGFQGCYAVVPYKDGAHRVEWMPLHEIEAIRRRSKAKDSGPWVTDPAEMVRKTPLRRMAKWLPLTPEITAGIIREEYREAGVEQVQEPARIAMPRRISTPTPLAGPTSPASQPAAPEASEPDYSADIPPLCPACEGAMKLVPAGYSAKSKRHYPAFWACPDHKDAKHQKKGSGSKTINATEWHEQEQARLTTIANASHDSQSKTAEPASSSEPAAGHEREPGDDGIPWPE